MSKDMIFGLSLIPQYKSHRKEHAVHINIALTVNLLQIVIVLILALPSASTWGLKDGLIFLVFIGVPCITLPLLYDFKYDTNKRPSSWLGLYLQRKRLEEQQKIEHLIAEKQ
jgi:hypothetical protein